MDELLALYASRNEKIGFKFKVDDELQHSFESDFEFELTPDQVKAVVEVKNDMESEKVMDRLICGDVGYGKTEVAIRAIFKAILSNKQAAFLCPTTILSRQHYLTMIDRFSSYGIRVVQLTRNTSSKAFKQIKEDLLNGSIDLVVGTHKLLGKEIKFKDLGLLIIDEEQRFGVKDKEKIKQLRNNVDVLTLSATPIPRTLQMSLSGLRKMSLLQTPPINRLPIQTYVVEKSQYLIREVIERELSRNGQVFYLYNRTIDIDRVAQKLQNDFPEIRVGIIHGKMAKAEVENVMEAFDSNDYQILVCTTIIETGIDIPNANTIIIEDANKFGLAQLYQIKGRVGRSDKVGYAYLLYQKDRNISEDAFKRLQAIKELTKLGSGYKIAMRDLAIRGAGDILGKAQSGNIEAVGYDMYLELLQEEIDKRNNIVKEKVIEPINLTNTGYIPKDLRIDANNRIALYQKIYKINNLRELSSIKLEVDDIYGKLPEETLDLFYKREFEIRVSKLNNLRVFDNNDMLSLQLGLDIRNKKLIKEVYEIIDEVSPIISTGIKINKLYLNIRKIKGYLRITNDLLERLAKIID
jgi:transcription-repair coupling factor (superfamily II helicase)